MSLEVFMAVGPTPAPVATVVIGRSSSAMPGVLDALKEQVYDPGTRYVIGGDAAVRSVAEEARAVWVPSMAELLERVPDEVIYLWILHDASRPRPGALQSLVSESYRVDASIAGSKILSQDNPDLLISVGMATDVFDVPYTGLEPGEMDQEQYQVVRDVAAVSGTSMLVRRDLMRGLGAIDDHLATEAAAIDFCQRARLRGARVVLVPSSEVLHPAPSERKTPPWREEAGRVRAMIKVYSWVTLLWALPGAFLTGLLEAIAAPVLGRWTLFNWVRTWGWNILFLPSTLIERHRARKGRVVNEGELFRYQLRGSARLRAFGSEAATWLEERFPERAGAGFTGIVEAGQETMRSPGFVSALVGVVFAAFATRNIWAGTLPVVGYTLPPAAGAAETLAAYAGGWNVAGLGSPEPYHPSIGAIALMQRLLFDRPELTAAVLTVLAVTGGIIGVARLLRHWGVRAMPAYMGGIVMMGGPAAQAIGGRTDWTGLLALGVVPWAIRVALRPWPKSWRGRIGALAAIGWLTGAAAAMVPAMLVVPVIAVALWALIGNQKDGWAVVRAGVGALVAIPLLFPWFGVVDLSSYLKDGGPIFLNPWWPAVAVVGAVAMSVLLGSAGRLASVAGWGATLGAAGILAARAGEFEAGRDIRTTGMILASIGTAAVVGAALEAGSRIETVVTWRRLVTAVGVLGAVLAVASTAVFAGPGRAGLPSDELRSGLRFTLAQGGPPELSRVLLAGPAETLPGDHRLLDGAPYRVVTAPYPRLWEARLAEPRLGDAELEATLRDIVEGKVARAGEALAPFGIKWVVITGASPFSTVFDGQLDLVPLTGLSQEVLLSEVDARRIVPDSGGLWVWEGPDYAGPGIPGTQVYLAENADQRWVPKDSTGIWAQDSWANRVSVDSGVISFTGPPEYRREALVALGLLLLLLALSIIGTGRRAR